MSFLKRAIRKGVGDAVSKAVQEAVEPKATEFVNKAARHLERNLEKNGVETKSSFGGLEEAFANLEKVTKGYLDDVGKNLKICPNCNEPAPAETVFCPNCGAKLPEQTLAQGAVCTACGKQNSIGTKFCVDCGTKLPAAEAEEQAAKVKDEKELEKWDQYLPMFPKWEQGGSEYALEELNGGICFTARYPGYAAAKQAVDDYGQVLKAHGFRPAGKYLSEDHLYSKVGNTVCHVDMEHCFEGDSQWPTLYFSFDEPEGGFDYVKPAPKQQGNLEDDLKKLLKRFK